MPGRTAGTRHVLGALLVAQAACGGLVVFEAEGDGDAGGGARPAPGRPTALFVDDEAGCGREVPVDDARSLLSPVEDAGETLTVVELAYVDECTGLGGHYILGRSVDGSTELWLGGHGCRFLDDAHIDGATGFGVARSSLTAALFSTPPDVCVSFPGESTELRSSFRVRAIAVFPTLDDAEAFADLIE